MLTSLYKGSKECWATEQKSDDNSDGRQSVSFPRALQRVHESWDSPMKSPESFYTVLVLGYKRFFGPSYVISTAREPQDALLNAFVTEPAALYCQINDPHTHTFWWRSCDHRLFTFYTITCASLCLGASVLLPNHLLS